MVGLLSAYIEHFTYLGLLIVLILCGLGVPLPEDIALLAGGYMVHRGVARYPITLAVSLIGVVTGDFSLFFIGRHFGSGLLRYFGLNGPAAPQRMRQMQDFMQRHGTRTILYARFLAGLRALVYLSAGSLGISPLTFFFYDVLGALISVPIVVSIGYLFGGQIELAVRYVGGAERVILILALLTLAVYGTRMLVPSRRPADSALEDPLK